MRKSCWHIKRRRRKKDDVFGNAWFGGSETSLGSIAVGLQLVSENLHSRSLRLGVEEVMAAGAEQGGQRGG